MIHGVLAFCLPFSPLYPIFFSFISFSPLYLSLVLSSFSFQMHHHISICPPIFLFACPLHLCSNCADDALSCLDELNHFIFTSMKCSVCCLVGWFIGCSRLKIVKKALRSILHQSCHSSITSILSMIIFDFTPGRIFFQAV